MNDVARTKESIYASGDCADLQLQLWEFQLPSLVNPSPASFPFDFTCWKPAMKGTNDMKAGY